MAFGFMAIHRQEWLVDEMITLAKGVKKNNNSKLKKIFCCINKAS